MKRIVVVAFLVGSFGCKSEGAGAANGSGATEASAATPQNGGTPVKVARVVRATLTLTVSGPGHTDALEQQKIRAPFKGILRELRVADGDRVSNGQLIAVIDSQESEAALTGARAMLRSATTDQERSDAERALKLAQQGVVKTELRAPEAGVVVSHGADSGALVAEAQDIVSLAATDSFVFLVNLVQTDLPLIRHGEAAEVRLAAQSAALHGTVYGISAAASAADLAAPVRIDLAADSLPKTLGLFGTAVITVGERRDVPVVPQAAILRDDINGLQRIAVVSGDGKAHWEDVTTGAAEGGRVEITAPALEPGTQVVVDGQVGLPEGAPVQVAP
ncbi:MAG TPA: efflux RND transporter periplasmic adaptor subunit [Myxococcales bacterium]|nr:efflux RND transporter periplasmic adaptor subunit [Myxococcales bacterium]